MTSQLDTPTPATSSLRESTWTMPVVLVGLGFLVAWRSVPLLPRDWLASIPCGLLFLLASIIPQLFLGERRKWISRGKGGRHLLCEAPEGPSRQKVPATFSPRR